MIALYRENRDLFIVNATEDATDPRYKKFNLKIIKVLRNDPLHGCQYKDGDEFSCGYNTEIAYPRAWELDDSPLALRDITHVFIDAMEAKIDKLQKFKEYVHGRLDAAGVPADPEPASNVAHGCRIEGRLNWVLSRVTA